MPIHAEAWQQEKSKMHLILQVILNIAWQQQWMEIYFGFDVEFTDLQKQHRLCHASIRYVVLCRQDLVVFMFFVNISVNSVLAIGNNTWLPLVAHHTNQAIFVQAQTVTRGQQISYRFPAMLYIHSFTNLIKSCFLWFRRFVNITLHHGIKSLHFRYNYR